LIDVVKVTGDGDVMATKYDPAAALVVTETVPAEQLPITKPPSGVVTWAQMLAPPGASALTSTEPLAAVERG